MNHRLRTFALPRLLTMVLAAVLVAGSLSACGFHLRGHEGFSALSGKTATVFLRAPEGLARDIGTYLSGSGIRLTNKRSDAGVKADVSVSVSGERFNRRLLSVDPGTGKEREFELVYTADVTVTRTGDNGTAQKHPIRLFRNYVYDSSQVIGTSHEEDLLREGLRREAARQIVRRLEIALSR